MKAKLAYLCGSASWGGLEMNHLRNAIWMQERGHDVVVIGVKDSPYAIRAGEMNLPLVEIKAYRKYYAWSAARSLSQMLRKQGITHLLIRATHDVSMAASLKQKYPALHVSYFMEMQIGVNKKGPGHTLRFKKIDVWSCPLPWLKNQVEEKTNYRNELVVIPSGMEREPLLKPIDSRKAREALNLPYDELLFGLIGRFDPQKGQLLLLEAMKLTENKSFHVLFIGEPTRGEAEGYFDQMQSVIQEHDLSNRVHIRPFQKDLRQFYAAIDWLVMATGSESIGMVTLEALTNGTPVLGSNAGGTPEILGENGGILFETENAVSLSEKLDFIAQHRPEFTPKSLQKLTESFDHHSVCEQVERTLNL